MNLGFDINKLRQEAQTRWLKPPEVFFILENHDRYPVTHEPPQKPPSGSLFFYNRRVLRFFRKDGHLWKRKKDGRTVGEAHERLKVGNVDALNCYYAHGEQNPYFQRRIYWILDPAYDHIVLVHYREVSEGRYISGSTSNLSGESFSIFSQSTSISKAQLQDITSGTSEIQEVYQNSSSPGSVEEVSSRSASGKFEAYDLNTTNRSGKPEVNQALQKLAEQLSLDNDDDGDDLFGEKLPSYCNQLENSHEILLLSCDNNGKQQIQSLGSEMQEVYQNSSSPGSVEEVSSRSASRKFEAYHLNTTNRSGKPEVNQVLQKLAEQFSLDNDDDDDLFGEKLPSYSNQLENSHENLLLSCDNNGKQQIQSLGSDFSFEMNQSPTWKDMLELKAMLELTQNSPGMNTYGGTSNLLASEFFPESSSCRTSTPETQFSSRDNLKNGHETLLHSSEREKISESLTSEQLNHGVNDPENFPNKYQISESNLSLQLSATRRFLLDPDAPIESPTSILQFLEPEGLNTQGTSALEANPNAMTLGKENSADWMGFIDSAMENCTYSWLELSQFENSLGTDLNLTVAQNQRFSIREISPEWAFSSEPSKILITGQFLCNPSEFPWAIMFGDIEVPLEIVQEGVLRCQAPQHDSGKVTLCITSGNRESCSEIREFEFRKNPNTSSFIDTSLQAKATKSVEELLLLAKFGNILFYGCDASSVSRDNNQWQPIIEALQVGCEPPSNALERILEELLRDKFHQWLVSKYQGKNCSGCSLSKQEQGIIHMISGLGYEWALSPILDSGVGINFRDVNGWTALHWAACFGREKMVAALLAAGSSAGAVTDPTPQDPVGKTPGAISASSGHKGLAAYLSEVALTSHLSSLTMEESEISKGSATVEAERVVEGISQRSDQMHAGGTEDELSFKDYLAAARNVSQAAARIQAAFRARSFLKRQQKDASCKDKYGMTQEDIHGLSAVPKFPRSPNQKFDRAALSIQKKYRGWKGRKDFLTLRQHVVKIQAHVRGHQVRKKYNELLWTVSVVEKVILRWRRRGVGLRGFRADPEILDDSDDEDIVKVFRKQKVDAALDQAVSRVLSMVDSPNARQQYRRMLEKYRQAKAEMSKADEATRRLNDGFEIIESTDYMY